MTTDVQPEDKALATELSRLLDQQAADWNEGRLRAFCSIYSDDALFISPGATNQGRDRILARYLDKYDSPEKRGRLTFKPIEVRRLGGPAGHPSAASVVLRWHIERRPKNADGLSMIVLIRTKDGWRIVQDASM